MVHEWFMNMVILYGYSMVHKLLVNGYCINGYIGYGIWLIRWEIDGYSMVFYGYYMVN